MISIATVLFSVWPVFIWKSNTDYFVNREKKKRVDEEYRRKNLIKKVFEKHVPAKKVPEKKDYSDIERIYEPKTFEHVNDEALKQYRNAKCQVCGLGEFDEHENQCSICKVDRFYFYGHNKKPRGLDLDRPNSRDGLRPPPPPPPPPRRSPGPR